MTLKALARQTLSRLSSQAVPGGTSDETSAEQVEQSAASCSTDSVPCSTPLEQDFAQKSAAFGACSTVPSVGDGTGGTRDADRLARAVSRLPARKPNVAGTDSAWREIVADARRLVAEGWLNTALALGWTAHDLFGVLDDREGLAVWLRGRAIILIDEDGAVAHYPDQPADLYRRRDLLGAKLLWEIN